MALRALRQAPVALAPWARSPRVKAGLGANGASPGWSRVPRRQAWRRDSTRPPITAKRKRIDRWHRRSTSQRDPSAPPSVRSPWIGCAAAGKAGGLAAVRAVDRRDLRPPSAWTSTRRAPPNTPERFLKALIRRHRRLRGRPQAADRVPDRVPLRRRLPGQPDHRGADPLLLAVRAPRAAVPRLRPRRLRRARADHRHLQADPAGAPLRPPLHRPGAPRRADRGRARGADQAARGRGPPARPSTCARRCAACARSARRP